MEQQTSQHLVFSISGAFYAINISFVLKIVELHQIARLPFVPEHILGLTNVSGAVQPVLDLRVLMGEKAVVSHSSRTALLLGIGESRICMTVDQVISLLEIDASRADAPLRRNPYVLGMTRVGQMDIGLLSAEKLLQGNKMTKS